MEPTSRILVSYLDERWVFDDSQHWRFGRGSGNDLDVEREPDELIHRRLGRVFAQNGVWWVANDGSRLSLAINDQSSTSSIVLAPGCVAALSFSRATIQFNGRRPRYKIDVDLAPDLPQAAGEQAALAPVGGSSTVQVPLFGEQRLLVVALAEHKLRNPHVPLILPGNKAVQARFGWTRKTFDGKLDRICDKFHRWGITALAGEVHDPAIDRRRNLVEYVIQSGLVTADDLALLDEYPAVDVVEQG